MSYYSQAQTVYSQQGWLYMNARRTTPPRDGVPFPLEFKVAGLRIGIVTSPIWL